MGRKRIYKYSRNPAFLGFDSVYIGFLLMFFNIPLLIASLSAILMLHLQILQEEAYLQKAFGEEYVWYQSRVNRYIGKKELMGGQFAANEQCTIVGLKLRAIENVRILGPVRKKSQVEISATDARTLGVNAPLRQSGDTAGSAPIALVGPKGVVYLNEGCIVAARHIHMTPAEAAAASLHDGDYVSVKMGNERGAVLDHVKIRVDESFSLEMHIDTDEANACQVKQGDCAMIV